LDDSESNRRPDARQSLPARGSVDAMLAAAAALDTPVPEAALDVAFCICRRAHETHSERAGGAPASTLWTWLLR
jgi:hypothetical protein